MGKRRSTTVPRSNPFQAVAYLVDGSISRVTVGTPPAMLKEKAKRTVVLTGDRGEVVSSGSEGIAIGQQGSVAKAGAGGLAQVFGPDLIVGGKASGGPRSVAVVRQGGEAETGDGGVAVTMRSGKSSVLGRGVAVAVNDRRRYDATAQANLGGVLVFAYCPKPEDLNTPMEYIAVKVDGKKILANIPYRITPTGQVIR